MNSKDFKKYVDKRLKSCVDTLFQKSDEYSRTDDKHHNFKRAGAMNNESPEKALHGMKAKHDVSLLDIIDDIEKYGKYPNKKMLAEKIKDDINYLLLLESLILEHIDNAERK
jgi:hypothetical protein